MSKKKKNGPSAQSEATGRPKLLAIICIVSGAVGLWYWSDRQSPPKSTFIEANGPRWDQPNSATVLIEPNTNDRMQTAEELATLSPNYGQLPADLVGSHQVELRPYSPPIVGTLDERVAREPLPVVPIARGGSVNSNSNNLGDETRLVLGRPPVWTDDADFKLNQAIPAEEHLQPPGTTNRNLATTTSSPNKADIWDTTNPFDQLALAPRSGHPSDGSRGVRESLAVRGKPTDSDWPDENFRPERNDSRFVSPVLANQAVPAVPKGTNPTLGVFGATNVAASPKIHPSEDPPTAGGKLQQGVKFTSAERIESLPAGWNPNVSDAKETTKSRAVIRQPKSGI